jgi:hypothetical protein
MFFFKKKPIVLDCFTSLDNAYTYAKIDYSANYMPEWWKRMTSEYKPKGEFFPIPTMKHCRGLIDLYARGATLSAWCDVAVEISKLGTTDYRWNFTDPNYAGHIHTTEQTGFGAIESFDTRFAHLKLVSPWAISCKEAFPFLWQEPTWNDIENFDYKVMPGTIEYKYQHNTNVNLIWRRKQETYTRYIRFGQPLAQIIPMSNDRKIKLQHHLVSQKEFEKFAAPRLKFVNDYATKRKEQEKHGSR